MKVLGRPVSLQMLRQKGACLSYGIGAFLKVQAKRNLDAKPQKPIEIKAMGFFTADPYFYQNSCSASHGSACTRQTFAALTPRPAQPLRCPAFPVEQS